MYLVVLGPPGAGKGTQAALLAKRWGLTHLSTGDLLRQAVETGTPLGEKVKGLLGKGGLVPDDIVIALTQERLESLQDRGAVLDGFPRTLEQARALDRALAGKGVDRAIFIRVSPEQIVRRVSSRWTCRVCQTPYNVFTSQPRVPGKCDRCGGELYQRADDTVEGIRKRLEVYLAQTVPVIEYYRERGKLLEVDGEVGVEEVSRRVEAALADPQAQRLRGGG